MRTANRSQVYHTVSRRGETLTRIAEWYTGSGSNWRAIQAANSGLNPKRLQIGERIYIPSTLVFRRSPMPASSIKIIRRPKVESPKATLVSDTSVFAKSEPEAAPESTDATRDSDDLPTIADARKHGASAVAAAEKAVAEAEKAIAAVEQAASANISEKVAQEHIQAAQMARRAAEEAGSEAAQEARAAIETSKIAAENMTSSDIIGTLR